MGTHRLHQIVFWTWRTQIPVLFQHKFTDRTVVEFVLRIPRNPDNWRIRLSCRSAS